MEYNKVKSAAKSILTEGPELDRVKLKTLKIISDLVGATLGPGGKPVLIERFEHDLPPTVTKDGVTVIRAMGFQDPAAQCIMEAARDASVRTATEAGDGTTTASVLAEAIVRNINLYCRTHPKVSPQKVVRRLETLFRTVMEPAIRKLSRKATLDTRAGQKMLKAVARVSANGDVPLSEAVMKCFEITGDEGNVTIAESSGASRYAVEQIKGYSIPSGYEDSCAKFSSQFVNDPGKQRCYLEKPVFILYHGAIGEIQRIQMLMEAIGQAWAADNSNPHNVVLVATGFSESVLATLGLNFAHSQTINVFPLVVPMSPQANGQTEFLHDLSAVTGAEIFNQLSKPLETATMADLGPGVESFEAYRTRSSVIGYADEDLLAARVDEIQQMLESPESKLDAILLRERKAKLSGGIAKLIVIGASNGELKEKIARADDAICAVRGSIRMGVIPGGGWTLMKLCSILPHDNVSEEILRPALMAPVERLLTNCGIIEAEEAQGILEPILLGIKSGKPAVYDFLEGAHVDPYRHGLLDSVPAVLEAIRNSISIASLLGTLGGTICFARNSELEMSEAKATSEFLRNANYNEANERP